MWIELSFFFPEIWVRKKEQEVNMKGGRKESLFPKNATHKGWKSPLIIVTMYKL